MPTFLWTGKDRYGNALAQRIEAANAQQAQNLLLERGYQDLQLILDEVADATAKMNPAPTISAEEQLRYYKMGSCTLREVLWETFKRHYVAMLVTLSLLVLGIMMKWIWVIIASLVGLVACAGFNLWFAQASLCYTRLNRAKVWSRWSEALRYVDHLRRVHRWTGIGVGELELARCRAQALAGLGRLDEGLNEFGRFQNSAEVPQWMYFNLLASIYEVAGVENEVVECSHKAITMAPEIPSVVLGHAMTLARCSTDVAGAKRYLEKAEKMVIPDLGQAFLPLCRGLIARSEGNLEEARSQLARALEGFESQSHMELIEGLILLTKSYLCSVHGRLGDTVKARQLFAECETFLRASKRSTLLSDCETAVS